MNIKLLSPNLTGVYKKYDSEEYLSDYSDSVFSLREFIDSELFMIDEKNKYLESTIDKGFYILKLLKACLYFSATKTVGENNVFKLVRGIKATKQAADDPLGSEFYKLHFNARMNELRAMHPEKYYMSSDVFDSFRQVYRFLDRDKRCIDFPDSIYEPSRVNFLEIVNNFLDKFRGDVEDEIGDYLTGSVYFSNRMKKATFIVDPSVFEVLNGGYRKSSRSNDTFIINDDDRISQIELFYDDLSDYIQELSSVVSSGTILQRQAIGYHPALVNLSNLYPAFGKKVKQLLENNIIEIRDDKIWWIYERNTRGIVGCFAAFCEYISEGKDVNWAYLQEHFNFNSSSLAVLKNRDMTTNVLWQKLQRILEIRIC